MAHFFQQSNVEAAELLFLHEIGVDYPYMAHDGHVGMYWLTKFCRACSLLPQLYCWPICQDIVALNIHGGRSEVMQCWCGCAANAEVVVMVLVSESHLMDPLCHHSYTGKMPFLPLSSATAVQVELTGFHGFAGTL